MASGYIAIEWWQLCFALGFVLLSGAVSVWYGLRLERDLAWGTVRTFVQLMAMGYILRLLFGLQNAVAVLCIYVVMTWFASRIVRDRVGETGVSYFGPTFLSASFSFMLVTMLVTAVIVQASPWWDPRYFIPIGGMVAGNSMNALAISLDRLFTELRLRRSEVEMRLCLGADYEEASRDIFRDALKSGMVPSINSMMGVGIVSLPGMMTGQILAGADPAEAVRYQIVVMLMIVAATALSSFLVLRLVRRRCFGTGHRLLVRYR
ncbi:Conserved hypothetical protein CHP00245 [Oleidesulfovibrio alaskensis G20]|uniref:Iron export ABC transporter permease subunit FetB n=1 Tax=Oleidesulfovibrio alaskensis (strain ATCC BAA-1058 / DSM 17464 / G20) TaxID=207559 RepID=Q30VP2_OLEA2|nr:iron export ABC transporter permease subunit FetB [Oleidesulfovibrio alaskensis]ABB40254.1 Conserved hypothetical protein CHP00245 [Oleidesulfovibrio alaskensis G20]MBG0772773.1 iron export ABC transporter permease subunit FetB [Oleidesulfovibrio alaskensis]